MRIAIIGWGSLIWCNKNLHVKLPWRKDGPHLPIEFTRKSGDSRLTLVLAAGATQQPTLWALSDCQTLEEAREDLQQREGTSERCNIGICGKGIDSPAYFGSDVISAWCTTNDFDGAVWTALRAKDPKGQNRLMSPEEALAYVQSLKEDEKAWKRAKEYVQLAPTQIDTPTRRLLRDRLQWENLALPAGLIAP
ncbi:MAG: hypothetical protein MN733_13070 [Nitrososphaera sp.]|nr:hypothetical protein [Nitrososphaera sp.]